MAIGLGDLIFAPLLHPGRENGVLDITISVIGLALAMAASRSKWNDRKPWIPPHDPMKNKHGKYDF